MVHPSSAAQVNVRALRSQLRALVDRARLGERIHVVSGGKLLGALVGPRDLRALNIDPDTSGNRRNAPDVRAHLREVLHGAQAGEYTLITVHGHAQAAIISPTQVAELPLQLPLPPAVTSVRLGPGAPDLPPPGVQPLKKEPSMQILSFWNESGGATKTTMVAELGYLLSQRPNAQGKPSRVLLIDLDPQRSLTHRMGLLDDPASRARRLGSTLNTVLQESDNDFPEPFTPARMPNLRVIPAHQQLRALENILISEDTLLVGLRDALVRLEGEYDFILIDTPPSNGGLTRAALVASHFTVVPMPTHIKSVENLENVTAILSQCRRLNPDLRIAAFIPTVYNKGRTQDREILELMHTQLSQLAPVTPPVTERPAIFRDVIPARGAVGLDQPRNPAAAELNAVLDHLLQVTGSPAREVSA